MVITAIPSHRKAVPEETKQKRRKEMWSIEQTTVQKISDDGLVYKPFVADLRCDPCAPSSERYEITTEHGTEILPWYSVIHTFDGTRDRRVKILFSKKVLEARNAVCCAEVELRKLIG